MFKKTLQILIIISLLGFISAYAQQDKPNLPKGQLLPAPLIVRSAKMVSFTETITSTVFEENFETGATSWSINGSWSIGAPTSGPNSGHNSIKCAGTNLSGNYSNNANDWLTSPSISLPELTNPSSQLKLNFWEWFEIESGYDHGKVKISTDGGTNWTELSDRSGSSDWRLTTVDISSYSGQTCKLVFHFTSDNSVVKSGWYVDDVQIVLEEPHPLTATLTSLNHQKFPFIYMNVAVDTFGVGCPGLVQSNFQMWENDILQTDYFEVTPPDTGGGVRLADIIFLMDNSGSMSEEHNAVRSNVIDFVNNLSTSGIDFTLGLCRFGASQNSGYPIIEDNGILTSDAQYFKNVVWSRNVIDGGHEPGWDAIYVSANSFSFRPGSQKAFILITDECVTHPGDRNDGNYSYADALNILRSHSATLFSLIDLDYTNSIQDYGTLAEATNGQYFDIYSPFDTILTYISSQVANTYLVRYKSSNPVMDGTQRNVQMVVSYVGNADTCTGSYIPGSAPMIQRTQATLDLHNHAWAEGTTFTIEADLVDNVAPYVQTAILYYRKTGITTYSSTNMSLHSGNTYRGTIPGSAVHTPGLDYYITATDGQNTASDPSVDPIHNPYQLAILPNVAPVITHTPVTTLSSGTPIAITAQIVDNTNSVASAKLHYRKAGQLLYLSLNLNHVGGDNYEGSIPANHVTNDGVEYYLQATDDLGVSGYYGTYDVPISIMNPLFYVTEKEAIINYFLEENFYVDVEQNARNFTNQVKQKINAGTATNKDIEALRRLSLVEEATKAAYPGAVQVAQLSSKCTMQMVITIVIEIVFHKLGDVLKAVKDWPIIKHLYKGIDDLIGSMKGFRQTIRLKATTDIGNRLTPHLVNLFGYSQPVAQSASMKIANVVFMEAESELYQQISEKILEFVGFGPAEELIKKTYLRTYENGIPFYFSSIGIGSGIFYIGGTKNAIVFSISDAANQNFQEGNVDVITQTIRSVKVPELTRGNTTTLQAINTRIDWAELVSKISLAVIIVVGVVAVIAGIVSCPAGGIGCIIAAIGGLGIWGAVSSLLTFFSAVQIGLYSWGMGIGIHQLHFNLPTQLYETQHIAFDKTTGSSFKQTYEGESNQMRFSSIPGHWVDSLVEISNEVAQKMSETKSLIQQDRWGEAGDKFELLSPKLEQLFYKENIVNNILDVSYLYNSDEPIAGLDSIYHYTGAYSAANDVGIGFARFSIGLALLLKPTGGHKDTLLQIINETMSRLQAVGPAYQQTFNRFNSWGFQVPPIVSIVNYSIEESKVGYTVQARIKNISDVTVHNVNVSLKSPDSIGVSVTAETDTLIPALNANEEKTFRWRVNYYGGEKIFILDLEVHPLVIPGDFQGDRKMISQLITETSPPTPGTLDNKNIYAYPNPFNPDKEEVTFRFKLAKAGNVSIKIYDVSNTLVATVISDAPMQADQELAVNWNGRNDKNQVVANGVYFFVIESSSGEKGVGKVAILR